MKIKPEYGKIILRIGLSLVFLWFGINQLYSPSSWTGFVPVAFSSIISASTLVLFNGSIEVILGLMMLTGIYVRFASLILGLHLLGIAFSLGFSAIAVRDFGLAVATLAVFFLGSDKLCLDEILLGTEKQKEI